MDVRQSAIRASTSTRQTSRRAITARQEVSFKGGNLYVNNPEYPYSAVEPGGVVDVSIEVCNAANYISPLPGGDKCTDGQGFRGYQYDIRLVEPDGTIQRRDNCLGMGGDFGDNCTQHEWSFDAPEEPGTYEFQVEARMDSSSSFDDEDAQTGTIVVEEGADTRPPQDGGGGRDGDDDEPDIPWTEIIVAGGGTLALIAVAAIAT